jgi:NAD(P)-dependent dehydrogenase (short-subunit alcohol dehydrogenase family)
VQHAVRELGVLRDLAQAGPGVAELGQRLQRGVGQLRAPFGELVTKVAAMESGKLGYAIRVNCIYPGLVPTEMGNQLAQDMVTLGLFPSVEECVGAVVGLTPHGRLGEVADMADAVVFLASDASRFITGAGLPVDGGMGM